MFKKKNYIFFSLLVFFSIYCAIIVGETWDERSELLRGKITLEYFFSLGKINQEVWFREYNSNFYYTLLYFFTSMFPSKYQIETSHIVNLFFSFTAIFGIRRLCIEFFNKGVANISFLILFFYPIFFGHMAFNSKDTIVASCHVWIVYLFFKYLKKQSSKEKKNTYIIYVGVLSALATGIKLVFLGSLIPVFLFLIFEIFYFKKIVNTNFSLKTLFYDSLKCIFIFYFLLIIFWIDVYPNIFYLPFEIIGKILSNINLAGWPYNNLNGIYYNSNEIPALYLPINIFYKSPEYILASYLFFIILMLTSINFFKSKFKTFTYKIFFLFLIISYANFILFILPFPVYDGMRLFLWVIPYFCIVPALVFYYFINTIKKFFSKMSLLLMTTLVVYFLYNFFIITPYQYTYLNFFNGKNEIRYKNFENDYWGLSNKQALEFLLLNKKENTIFIGSAGPISLENSKKILNLEDRNRLVVKANNEADFIIDNYRNWFGEYNKKRYKVPDNFKIYKEISRRGRKIISIYKKS